MIIQKDLQDSYRALTHMLFRNVPLVEEIHTKQLVIAQNMMRNLNIKINNRIYSLLYIWSRNMRTSEKSRNINYNE